MEELYSLFLQSTGVNTDTRVINKNNLFFALKGPNFNANKLAKQAIEKGVIKAIIDDEEFKIPGKTILVENVLKTLQQLARYHRYKWGKPILALTGSNGKTTTKELLHITLSKKYKVHATQGNLNNHIGVPLTLLQIKPEHELAIVEMGANHIGEITELCQICNPDHGLITNIGKAHLEGFGSQENIAKGKKELFDWIKAKKRGNLFINMDDPFLKTYNHDQTIKYSIHNESIYKGVELKDKKPFASIEWGKTKFTSQLIGGYNNMNIMAAVAVGRTFNVSKTDIQKAIKDYIPGNNRSQYIKTEKNEVILDAYNANPSSMEESLKHFIQNDHPQKKVILGDMFELGETAREHHTKIVNWLKQNNLQGVLAGKEFCATSNGYLCEETAFSPNIISEIQSWENTLILIKGSRGMKLEQLLDYL